MDMNIIKVALDAVKGKVPAEFSAEKTSDSLREAFVELNGGSTKINPKNFYRGNGLFELVEELIPAIVHEGLTADNALMSLVDYRNIAQGDENEFYTKGKSNLIVKTAAPGIQGVRRQRLADGESTTVKTVPHTIRVYDSLNRFLAGRVDFNDMVTEVGNAFLAQAYSDAYACLNGITASTAGLSSTYVISGTFSEDNLITLIEHVEAATGLKARIIGTKAALHKVTSAIVSDKAKDNVHNFGYFGSFNGTDMIEMKQAHKVGTDTFELSDSKIYVIASADKPVKLVNEGDGIMQTKEATNNADLTQEYVYILPFGTGLIIADKLGIDTIS